MSAQPYPLAVPGDVEILSIDFGPLMPAVRLAETLPASCPRRLGASASTEGEGYRARRVLVDGIISRVLDSAEGDWDHEDEQGPIYPYAHAVHRARMGEALPAQRLYAADSQGWIRYETKAELALAVLWDQLIVSKRLDRRRIAQIGRCIQAGRGYGRVTEPLAVAVGLRKVEPLPVWADPRFLVGA